MGLRKYIKLNQVFSKMLPDAVYKTDFMPKAVDTVYTSSLDISCVDELTGLPNRNFLLSQLKEQLREPQEGKNNLTALLVIDVDHFRVINNSLGIAIGDNLLIQVAKRLKSSMRSDDYVVRLGGDEFAIVVSNLQDIDSVLKTASRIHEELMSPFYFDGREVFIGTSMGITNSFVSLGDAEDFFRDADIAMNYAKSLGRSCLAMFRSEMHQNVVQHLDLANSLRHALKQKEFFIEYQPIVSLVNEELVGFEALIRWRHPIQGIIPPSVFIPIAEEIGLIESIGEWVLKEACQQTKSWQTQFELSQSLTISVNLSAKQIFHKDLLEQIKGALEDSGLAPCYLKLEITESILLEDKERIIDILKNIRSLGVHIAVDDFGTGYSSLSYLIHFPFDTLKLDSSFTKDIEKNHKKFSLVKGILMIGHSLGIQVVAEGIEIPEQVAQFKALQCGYGQGYLFSKSLIPEKVSTYISSNIDRSQHCQVSPPNSESFYYSHEEILSQDQLLIKIEHLNLELKQVKQEKEDLEILLELATDHAGFIESEMHQEITSYQEAEINLQMVNRHLQELSYVDGLTQIANRRHFDEYIFQEWKKAVQEQQAISLILGDVDFFKLFNDEYGHQSGDYCLIKVAQVLSKVAATQPGNLAARYGGEEFGIILPAATPEKAVKIAANIRALVKSLEIPNARSPVNDYVTISLGVVSTVPCDLSGLKHFIDLADQALYGSKVQGRDRFSLMSC